MKNDHKHVLKTTTTAVMIALTCVLTLAVKIPTPTKGYLNLGDCAVLLSGWLLGPAWGAVAGGVGSALEDTIPERLRYPAFNKLTTYMRGGFPEIATEQIVDAIVSAVSNARNHA